MPRTITRTLSDLNIATRDFMKATVSAINNDNYFSARMLARSEPFTGGEKITVPLLYGRENVQAMTPYDEYTLQPTDMLDQAEYEIKHINGSMTIDQIRLEVKNIGKAADIKLAKTKSMNMSTTMKHEFSEMLFKAVADLSDEEPDSLIKICATENNTVGGINANTEDRFDWNPHILDWSSLSVTYANLTDPTSPYFIEKLLRKLIGPVSIDKDTPTIGLTTQGVWDSYEEVLRADKRFNNMTADAGFNVLTFREMKIAVDSHVPGGKMNVVDDYGAMFLAVNEKYIGYSHAVRMNFKWTPWMKLQRQPVYASLLDWAGAVICRRRDRQAATLGLPTDAQVYA